MLRFGLFLKFSHICLHNARNLAPGVADGEAARHRYVPYHVVRKSTVAIEIDLKGDTIFVFF